MQYDARTRVLFAFFVGGCFVVGALALKMFNTPVAVEQVGRLEAAIATPSERDFISVTDSNSDGIEDWREEFVTEKPLTVESATATVKYEIPKTLTDRVGIQLFQASVRDKSMGQYGRGNEVITSDLASEVTKAVKDRLYTKRDIITIPTSATAIKTYGNTLGQSLINHDIVGAEWEMDIVNRALSTQNESELQKLDPLIIMYQRLRDDALNAPVPDRFVTEHLNLINSYNAMYESLTDLKLIFSDPMVSLLRIKRYEDDARGLGLSLHNIYLAAIPYESLFTKDDPALVFVRFANI